MTAVSTLILASASPRRRALLRRLHVPFSVESGALDERPFPGESPLETVRRVAVEKAQAVAAKEPQAIILAADTIVVWDNRILGKPKDHEEARWMLRSLRGRAHQVVTAIALLNAVDQRMHIGAVSTKVWMRNYSDPEIETYIASGDPFDKAGAYAIQNQLLHPVERIDGCYFNVVGLPLCEVVKGLIQVGYHHDRLPTEKLDEVCPHDVVDVGFEA